MRNKGCSDSSIYNRIRGEKMTQMMTGIQLTVHAINFRVKTKWVRMVLKHGQKKSCLSWKYPQRYELDLCDCFCMENSL